MFQPVSSRMDPAKMEEEILKLWKERDTFRCTVTQRQSGPRYTLYEGPPTANGSPGIHHVLSRVFKDIMPRYKAMKGYYTPRIAGWDTHGLPVELEVEKELGLATKADIEKYGIAKFNTKCRQSVFRYLKEWEEITERVAFWIDLEHAYVTMNNEYIESGWWVIKQLWDKGLVYQGHKVTPHCPRCGTSLSSHEVALGYKEDTEDPSVYIKFKVVPETIGDTSIAEPMAGHLKNKPSYLLAWTTTPWTLPGNTALAVAADEDYAVLEVKNEYLIMASALLKQAGLASAHLAGHVRGSELLGIKYQPLFNPIDFNVPIRKMGRGDVDKPLTYPVIAADFVSMEDGTGIVHIAPAFGEVDYEAGKDNNLHFVQNVDLQGDVIGTYPFAGRFAKEADNLIISKLRDMGQLFRSEKIHHTYPFCWRCDTPLLYYAKETWYIKTTIVKKKMLAGNESINWYPEHIKQGRFGDWLANNVDWAVSRERYWGTPLPVWKCQSCGELECIGGMEELNSKLGFSGFAEPLDLHRPYVDELTYDCSKCDGKMKRISEVMDCWFDSGAMPVAQWHYPFDSESKSIFKDGRFPADYISEAIDQTRGWFYSLHALSTLLFDKPSYKNVICLGLILDEKGEKMSKTRGNVVQPMAVIKKHGADALRWYLFTAAPPGNARRFSQDLVAEVSRRFLFTLWNVYSFFVMYANIDEYQPGMDDDVEKSELDRWILSELNALVRDVDNSLENYNPTGAGRLLESFMDYLSNWYVRRSRRRFWKSENDADKLAAYSTLYKCLVTLAKLLAPFTPFISEAIYQNLVYSVRHEALDSIHLTDFPTADESVINEQLMDDTRLAMKVSSLGRAARSGAGIKVRQPLAEVLVGLTSKKEGSGLERLKQQVLEELNVKELRLAKSAAELDKSGYTSAEDGGYMVAVDTNVTPELEAEGMAREIVHRLQTMRRQADFEIDDHIITFYEGDDYVTKVMADFAEYIMKETLSAGMVVGAPEDTMAEVVVADFVDDTERVSLEIAAGIAAESQEFKIAGHAVKLAVARLP